MKVTKQNYEEYALDYIEETLPVEQQQAFERFLDGNPEIAAEVYALREEMPVLVPDLSVRFDPKSALKRKAVVRPLYLRIASAAAVLLAGVLIINHYWQGDVEPQPTPDQPLLGSVETTGEQIVEPAADIVPQNLLADAAPAPVQTTVKTQPVATPMTGMEARRLIPDRSADTRVQTRSPQTGTEQQPTPETEVKQTREVITVNPQWQPITEDMTYRTPEPVVLAEASAGRVVSVTHEFVIEQTNEPVLLVETQDYFDLDNSNQAGFLNVLTRKGFRKLASDIIAPLSEISPIKVYNSNEERVVEFASIPVSRRSNAEQENQ